MVYECRVSVWAELVLPLNEHEPQQNADKARVQFTLSLALVKVSSTVALL